MIRIGAILLCGIVLRGQAAELGPWDESFGTAAATRISPRARIIRDDVARLDNLDLDLLDSHKVEAIVEESNYAFSRLSETEGIANSHRVQLALSPDTFRGSLT